MGEGYRVEPAAVEAQAQCIAAHQTVCAGATDRWEAAARAVVTGDPALDAATVATAAAAVRLGSAAGEVMALFAQAMNAAAADYRADDAEVADGYRTVKTELGAVPLI